MTGVNEEAKRNLQTFKCQPREMCASLQYASNNYAAKETVDGAQRETTISGEKE